VSEMPDILGRICARKREEIKLLRRAGEEPLRQRLGRQSPPRPFRSALLESPGVALIAEVKRASPSAGVIRRLFRPAEIARACQRGGARCISVLTDRPFFQGSLEDLVEVRSAVRLPVLRKDFILDPIQVLEARAWGADCVLLIVAALEADQLDLLMREARALGMDALVEVHEEAELELALQAGADMVGINNRNLHTFEVNTETTRRLAPRLPEGVLVVAESGITSRADVESLKLCGVKAVLVGESLMRADDIAAASSELSDV